MRRALLGFIALLTLGLAACGGGGDEPQGDLYVTVDYPTGTQTVNLFDDLSVSPTLAGFGSATPQFVADGPLPQGFVLSSSNGTISGYAGIAGTQIVNIRVSASGYEGSLYESVWFDVRTDISFSYPSDPSNYSVNAAMAPKSPVITGLLAGDTVSSFRLGTRPGAAASVLPPGVSLNAQTGVLSGTPSAQGIYVAWVDATVTRGTKTATIGVTSYVYFNVQ